MSEISAGDWSLHDVRVALGTDGIATAGRIVIARIQVGTASLSAVNLECARLRVLLNGLDCTRGRLQVGGLTVAALDSISFRRSITRWQAKVDLRELKLDALAGVQPLLARAMPDHAVALEGYSAAGVVALNLQASGADDGTAQIRVQMDARDLALSNADSTWATDGMVAKLDLQIKHSKQRSQVEARLSLNQGYGYVLPVLQDYSQFPASAHLAAIWNPRQQSLDLETLEWQQAGVIQLKAAGQFLPTDATPIQALQLDVQELRFPGVYSQLLEPFLAGTALDGLDTSGQLSGRAHWQQGKLANVVATISDLHIDDRERRFAIYGLDGVLNWSDQADGEGSELAWDGFYVGRLPFAAARWSFKAAGSSLSSANPLRVGLFDGAVVLERIRASWANPQSPEITFQGYLQPISLPLLSSALGLPSFPGTLAGRLPPVSYTDQSLHLDGELAVDAFGGSLIVDQLRIEQALGLVPRARANLRLRGLDLAQVTSVFDFGRIDGRLNADIRELELENWLPVAFDARLYTPPEDAGRHRISQRAMNNISRVGGGGAVAALSSGVMRYFENFGYRRIGWSCVLTKGVCEMGGVPGKVNGNGYYIVQGHGLPRIDVVAYARRVSWNSLLQQLQAVSSGGPATVE